MRKFSLIAVDLDGTLLTSQRTLAPRGAALLQRAARQGIHVVLATTRNPDVTSDFCRSLGVRDPMICTNGAQVWGSPDGPVWAYHAIPRRAGLAIARWADEHRFELSVTVGSMKYWRQRPGQQLGPIRPNVTVVASNADAMVGEPVRILALGPEAVEGLCAFCEAHWAAQCRVEIYYHPDGTPESLCIVAPQADKGTALSLVCRRLGVSKEQVLAIGDNMNDVPMFASAGWSVAMGNAVDEVKQHASAVAPSNDQEGVAWALERFVFTTYHGQDGSNGTR